MKYKLLVATLLCGLSLSSNAQILDVYYRGSIAQIKGKNADNMTWTANGTHVKVKSLQAERPLTLILHGQSDNGTLSVSCPAGVRVELDNLHLTSQEGAPLNFKKQTKVELVARKETVNELTVVSCVDTVKYHSSVIFCKDDLTISGKGTLSLLAQGDGCKGINVKANLTIQDISLSVRTMGENRGVDTTMAFPFWGGGPMGPPPGFDVRGANHPPFGMKPDSIPEEVQQHFERIRQRFESIAVDTTRRGFPHDIGGNPMGMGMPLGKHKYIGTPKGIKAKGCVKIESGSVYVSTAKDGGEGIEGKAGVIINGGKVVVDAIDDGINSGGSIHFNGGFTTVISRKNDAVDANGQIEGAITIAGGTVFAFSQAGPPEEGVDCDFSPIVVKGGTLFSIGAGMGEMPSVPTAETAQQPTALLIGLNTKEGEFVAVCDSVNGKTLFTFTAPFDFERSSSLISCPHFHEGCTYIVRSSTSEHALPLTSPFTIIGRSSDRFTPGGFPPFFF